MRRSRRKKRERAKEKDDNDEHEEVEEPKKKETVKEEEEDEEEKHVEVEETAGAAEKPKMGHVLPQKGVGSEMKEDGEGGLGSIPASADGAPPPPVSPPVLLHLRSSPASPSRARPGQPFIPIFLFQRARCSISPLSSPSLFLLVPLAVGPRPHAGHIRGPDLPFTAATKRTAQASADLPGSHFRLGGNIHPRHSQPHLRHDVVRAFIDSLIVEDLNSQTVIGRSRARLLWLFKISHERGYYLFSAELFSRLSSFTLAADFAESSWSLY